MQADLTQGRVQAESYGLPPNTESDAGRNENRNENRNRKAAGDHEGVHPLAQKRRPPGLLGAAAWETGECRDRLRPGPVDANRPQERQTLAHD